MSELMLNLLNNLRALPPGRQAILGMTAMGSLAFLAWVVVGVGGTDYRPLYRGIDPAEAATITDALREERIDYQLDAGGTTVLVDAAQLHEARIRIAGRGLPGGGNKGLELFDEPAFGVSDFVHRINFVRATQGELARTIEQLEPVTRARVQVVIPERKSVLAAAERKPSASVVVGLRPGWELDRGQVRAIVHLVASSIESLDPKAVTVVDSAGSLLAPLGDDQPGSLAGGGGADYQAKIESEFARRIERILEKTVGEGGVVARVSADLDWTESETTQETFDPDSQVARSERLSTETSNEGGVSGGVAGATANLPDSAGGFTDETASSRTTETINYEISKTVSRTITPMGQIERLSIAILVADQPPVEVGGQPVAWPETSLELFGALARQAVGFDSERGDIITVRSAPFRVPELTLQPEGFPWATWLPLLSLAARGALVLVALLLFAKLIVAPIASAVPDMSGLQLPARLDQLESEVAGGEALAAGGSPSLGAGAAGANPEEGARALRNWLSQG
jgi:flagellar M-ring protein FliF